MYGFGKSPVGARGSSGKSEGRFLEPSQLKLQATGSTVMEKPRDFVRPAKKFEALDFRLTKDTGVIRGVADISLSTSSLPSTTTPTRRVNSGDIQNSAGYLRMYNTQESVGSGGELSDSSSKRSSRSSSATMNTSSHRATTEKADEDDDKVMIAESSSAPGVPIIYRPPEEKAANPDRLNLDRRRLAVCPILDGEDQLRLLNYQHNNIRKIGNLQTLKKLIFLDLYDNQIEEISGLSNLKSLRVLMLGKNRIKKIEHLDSLTKLDVLDLHGNEIQIIENINHLTELRVLNLAGNRISFVDNLIGMMSLAELNLRRNQIKSLTGVDQLPSLQRLFLSCNELCSFDDIVCLAKSHSLQEISLDGNPIASDQFYKQTILSNMQQLKQLDMKRVTDEEKRISAVMARKEEDRKRELQKISLMKEKRKQAIHTAKQQWEMMQSTMMGKSNRLTKMPEIYANHVATYDNPRQTSDVIDEDTDDQGLTDSEPGSSRPLSAQNNPNNHLPVTRTRNLERMPAKNRSQSESRPTNPPNGTRPDLHEYEKTGRGLIHRGNGLAELDGDTLTCYGPGSVDSLDRNWGIQAAGAVTTIMFKFIEFGDVVTKAFNKIRSKFPSAHSYEFTANNIHSFDQLNALSQLRRIENLYIHEEGNPVTQISMWRQYLIFRLAHFSIKTLNGQENNGRQEDKTFLISLKLTTKQPVGQLGGQLKTEEKIFIDEPPIVLKTVKGENFEEFSGRAYISSSDIVLSEKLFGSVSHKVSEYLPNFRMLALLPETRKKQLLAEEKVKNSGSINVEDAKAYGNEPASRAVLSYTTLEQGFQAHMDYKSKKKIAHSLVTCIAKETVAADHISTKLSKSWDKSFIHRVSDMCVNMLDSNYYTQAKMDKFLRAEQT